MLPTTRRDQFVCAGFVESSRGILRPYPQSELSTRTLASLHWQTVAVCLAAGLGVKEVELETSPTDAMVGGTGAAGPAPDLQHQPHGRRIFIVKK